MDYDTIDKLQVNTKSLLDMVCEDLQYFESHSEQIKEQISEKDKDELKRLLKTVNDLVETW